MELEFLKKNPKLYEPRINLDESTPIRANQLSETLASRNRNWVLSREGQVIENSIESLMNYLGKNPDNEIIISGIVTILNDYSLYVDKNTMRIIGCVKGTRFTPGTEQFSGADGL